MVSVLFRDDCSGVQVVRSVRNSRAASRAINAHRCKSDELKYVALSSTEFSYVTLALFLSVLRIAGETYCIQEICCDLELDNYGNVMKYIGVVSLFIQNVFLKCTKIFILLS